MHFLQAINSDISVLIVCNKTGGTIKRDKKEIKKRFSYWINTAGMTHLKLTQQTKRVDEAWRHNPSLNICEAGPQ